jgi:hypothetical protein
MLENSKEALSVPCKSCPLGLLEIVASLFRMYSIIDECREDEAIIEIECQV